MSRPRKLLLAAGGAVAALLLALLVLPALFIDRVESRVRVGIEQATLVRVAWSDVHLGFFRDFPNPTLTLHGLDVVGTERFEGDTLASVGDLRLSMSGPSLINAIRGGGPLVIRSVQVDRPIVRLRVEDDGVSNWDVLPERDEAETGGGSGRNVAVELQRFEVSDADIVLDDAPAGLFVSARGLEHWLRGDFSRASLAARTSTRADAVELRVAGAPYLTDISLEFDAELDVDMGEQRVRLSDNELRLNDLVVRLDGDLSRSEADIAMDLTFGAPSTSFEQILSLLPVLYAQDFASLETSGSFALDGTVQGAYGPTSFPSFAVDLSIADGRFRYPDVPIPVQGITAELAITNPGGDVDSTVVDLSRLHFEIGDQPMDAALTVRTPVSDPEADVRVEGTIDLNDAARALKLEGADELRGVIVADANARARRSDVDNQRWDRVAAGGTITAQDVTLRGASLRQPVDVRRARLHLTPRTAELQAFDARLGSSDVSATGHLDNLLGFALGGETLVGAATFGSERFHLDEWRSEDPIAIPVPKMLDLTLDGTISTLVFNGLEMTNARGRGLVRGQRLTLEGFMLEALGGRIGLDGYYETAGTEQPTFALDVVMDSVDVAGASAAFVTVRTLAPVARHARGTFSTNLHLSGALGQDLSPVLDVLEGEGSLSTS
ncbi:MAG: hypothetical protein OEN00_11045, partial [Gemmatimonadota bacterium]|nr:hypothetical protein [Gemmatimonadota bacterium]